MSEENQNNHPGDRLLPGHEAVRLSDGREQLGDALVHPVDRENSALGEDFNAHNSYDGPRLGEDFAEPDYADQHVLGSSFADPNSQDDMKLGRSFADTNSSAKKHHRPVGEVVGEPFRKAKSNRILPLVVIAVVVIFLLVLFLGWIPRHNRSKEASAQASKEKQAPEVDAVRVKQAKDSAGLVIPGTTTPLIEASVYARANGYLKARYVDIGDHVRKGQILALIDAPDLDQQVDQAREQLRQAQAQVAQQETQLALTKVTTDRYRALVERGVFSRQDGDQREADYQAQRANVTSAERNVEAFRANLRRVIALQSYERVTAPFDGVVTERNVDVGALISASGSAGSSAPSPMQTGQISSSTTQNAGSNTGGSSGNGTMLATPTTGGAQGGPLFTIAQDGRLRILVSVPEGYASMIHTGQHTLLHFQEYADAPFYGDVTRTAGSIDQNTRTLLTEIQIDNSRRKLLPGMYAVATFNTQGPGPLVVSGDAIAIRKDQPMVAVIDNDKIKLTPVIIGRDYGPEVEITSGLRAGQLIASSFTDDVQDGAPVRVHMDEKNQEAKAPTSVKPQPPGGSTQYGDPGITDQDMQGQNAKPQQKQQGGGSKKAAGKSGSQQ